MRKNKTKHVEDTDYVFTVVQLGVERKAVGGREGGREGERENSNSQTLILKDSCIRPMGTYLTASPCYTTNTNKHDNTTNIYYKQD